MWMLTLSLHVNQKSDYDILLYGMWLMFIKDKYRSFDNILLLQLTNGGALDLDSLHKLWRWPWPRV